MKYEDIERAFIEGALDIGDKDMVLTARQLDEVEGCDDLFPIYSAQERMEEERIARSRFRDGSLFFDRGIKYQAAIAGDAPIRDVLQIFGTVESVSDENGTVYVTRGYASPEKLKMLLGTLQTRLERKGKHMRGALIQPLGAEVSTNQAKYVVKGSLKARMDYGTYQNPKVFDLRTPYQTFYGMKRLEHPDTVIIPPNEYYPAGLTERQIVDYYDAVSGNIIANYVEMDLDGSVFIKIDDRMIIKRHAGMDVLSMKIGDQTSFDKLNSGRAVEFHFAVGPSTKVMWIDLDPKEGFPWDEVKRTAANILELFGHMERVMDTRINFSGRNGFHVYAVLENEIDVDEAHGMMERLAQSYVASMKDDRLTTSITRRAGTMRLDVSTLHNTGGLRVPYSLAYPTGLVCLPLAPNQLASFEKEQATIYEVMKHFGKMDKFASLNIWAISMGKVLDMYKNFRMGELPSLDSLKDFVNEYRTLEEEAKKNVMAWIKNRSGAAHFSPEAFNKSWNHFVQAAGELVDVGDTLRHYFETGGEIIETGDWQHVYRAYDYLKDDNNYSPWIVQYMSRELKRPIKWDTMLNIMTDLKQRVDEFLKRIPSEPAKRPEEGVLAKPAEEPKNEAQDKGTDHKSGIDVRSELEKYKQKRRFDVTSEPPGDGKEDPDSDKTYVIQEHRAQKAGLHYDLRLADRGVLKSWAVRKLPEALNGKLVLAKEVEDHPLEYAAFEGKIPAGQYGAGTVTIWDKGTYETISRDNKKWYFRLDGEQLKGPFVLINTGSNNWLLRRVTDK